MRLTDRRLYRTLVFNSELAAGEAYMDGSLRFEDGSTLRDFLQLFSIDRLSLGSYPIQKILRAIRMRFRKRQQSNRKGQAQQNVAHHYDLGNDFYKLFLDRNMLYSCAYFREPDETLEQAQRNKLRLLAASQFKTTTTYNGFVPYWPGITSSPRLDQLKDVMQKDLGSAGRELLWGPVGFAAMLLVGAAYMIWVGVGLMRSSITVDRVEGASAPSQLTTFWRGFTTRSRGGSRWMAMTCATMRWHRAMKPRSCANSSPPRRRRRSSRPKPPNG